MIAARIGGAFKKGFEALEQPGLASGGVFFGIIARDTLYLKVGDSNRADYTRAGMKAFTPYADRSGSMKYYAVPLEILESPIDLAVWAGKAIAVASGGT